MSTPDAAHVVVLTAGNPIGLELAQALDARGVRFDVLLQSEAALSRCFRHRGWRRIVELPIALARVVHRRGRTRRWRRALQPLARRVVVSGSLDSARMRDDLARLAPDLLALGGVGLVSGALLAIPHWGTVNGHPGLLPWVRGSGVVGHAILRDVAVGATVHRVDEGIDRGAIIARRLLPPGAGPHTLPQLERDALTLALAMLSDVVACAVRDGALPGGVAQRERTPLCRWIRAAERMRVEELLRDGAAARLFEQWCERYALRAPTWELPPDTIG